MPAVRRPVVALMGASFVLAGVVACASSVDGSASYAGAGATTDTTQTTTESTETTTESTTETTETTTESTTTGPGPEEFAACLAIPLSDVGAFQSFTDLADMPEADQTPEARMAVADEFDTAIQEVQTYIDPLPEGPIKDASIGYQDKQKEVRDKLISGDDVSTQIILDAQDILQAACGTG